MRHGRQGGDHSPAVCRLPSGWRERLSLAGVRPRPRRRSAGAEPPRGPRLRLAPAARRRTTHGSGRGEHPAGADGPRRRPDRYRPAVLQGRVAQPDVVIQGPPRRRRRQPRRAAGGGDPRGVEHRKPRRSDCRLRRAPGTRLRRPDPEVRAHGHEGPDAELWRDGRGVRRARGPVDGDAQRRRGTRMGPDVGLRDAPLGIQPLRGRRLQDHGL